VSRSPQTAYFDVSDNDLTGSIPNTLENVGNLTWLDLSYNLLTGSLPSSLFALHELLALGVQFNMLNGTLPNIEPGSLELLGEFFALCMILCSPWFLASKRLEQYLVSHTLSVNPDALTPICVVAAYLVLSGNSFRGTIPDGIGNLQSLEYFLFAINQLTGSLPTSLLKLSSLVQMHGYDNQLTGTLPFQKGSNLNMTLFWFDSNNFTGTLEPLTYLPK
jgi:Leucine-rich repeat (LRR) protein